MRHRGKSVPYSCLPISLALRQDDGAEGFCVLNPRHDVAQDSGESGVILWRGDKRGGEGGDMLRRPAAEPGPHALVREQQ